MTKEQISAWLHEYVSPNGMPGDFTPSEVMAILEEFQRTPSPSGSLEEAAKEYAATGWRMIDGGAKEYNEEIYNAVLYGASLSRPSIDIVDELRKAIPPYVSLTAQNGWTDCCNKLQELLNQSK